MLLQDITGDEINIESDYFQAAVSQYLLQAEDIASVHQVGLSKRVTKSVRVTPCPRHLCFLTEA